jgi:hypothetical protein
LLISSSTFDSDFSAGAADVEDSISFFSYGWLVRALVSANLGQRLVNLNLVVSADLDQSSGVTLKKSSQKRVLGPLNPEGARGEPQKFFSQNLRGRFAPAGTAATRQAPVA